MRFSARLKWTRPTRFQAGLRDLRNSWTESAARGELRVEGRIGGAPQVGERRRRQVFRTGHGRDGRRRRGQLAFAGERNRRLGGALAEFGQRAQRGDVARTEIAPIRQHRRQRRRDLVGAQRQQSVARAATECLLQPGALRRLQLRRLLVPAQRQHAMRRENRHQHRHVFRIDAILLSPAAPGNRRSLTADIGSDGAASRPRQMRRGTGRYFRFGRVRMIVPNTRSPTVFAALARDSHSLERSHPPAPRRRSGVGPPGLIVATRAIAASRRECRRQRGAY